MVYSEVHKLYKSGFSERKIAIQLEISRNTVSKYLDMTSEEMSIWLASSKTRRKKLDNHEGMILEWLREFPDLSSAQISDWLEERGILVVGEATVRNFVRELRKIHHIPKQSKTREYEAIPDMPMGHQLQVDFGELWAYTIRKVKLKLYVIAFVLSYSRYKFMLWQDRPFNSGDMINAHREAFKFLGGKPKEIVYDQDSLVLVRENSGDLIFTEKFESYRNVEPFEIYMCRKSDPETKGRIENVIGFIKNNFAKNRVFTDLESWNNEALSWLTRRGNGKTHNSTKKIPAEAFEQERLHLRSVSDAKIAIKAQASMHRKVRKDNTIMYLANRYSVPLGTYITQGKDVELCIDDNKMMIVDVDTGEIIAEHVVSVRKGILVQDRSHTRNRKSSRDELMKKAKNCFGNTITGNVLVEKVKDKYPRYLRDQLQIIFNLADNYDIDILNKAAEVCINKQLYSANDFRDTCNYLTRDKNENLIKDISVNPECLHDEESRVIMDQIDQSNLELYMKLLEDE